MSTNTGTEKKNVILVPRNSNNNVDWVANWFLDIEIIPSDARCETGNSNNILKVYIGIHVFLI